jgi:hypothetical protein
MANLEEFVRPPITVTAYARRKINTGNYESLDIEIGVTDIQLPDESRKDAMDRVFNSVVKYLGDKEDIVRNEIAEAERGGGY